jgi:hypothetical protein
MTPWASQPAPLLLGKNALGPQEESARAHFPPHERVV